MQLSSKRDGPDRRRSLARFGLALAATLLTLLIAEGVIRSLFQPGDSIRFSQSHMIGDEKYEGDWGAFFEQDPELFWRLAPGQQSRETQGPFVGVVSNAQGLREDHEIPFEKPPDSIRILFLGDSVTFGFLLPHDQTFPEYVEDALQERFPELAIESINAGVPGYTLFQGWRYLMDEGLRYQPDVVVAGFGWNGGESWDGASDPHHDAAQRRARPPAAIRGSRIAQLLWGALFYESPTPAEGTGGPRLSNKQFDILLHRVRRAANEAGIELLILVPPGRFNIDGSHDSTASMELHWISRKRAMEWASQPDTNVRFIDGVATAQRLVTRGHASDELLLDDIHPTPLMNEALALDIADALTPWIEARTERAPR
ncbi:MAG: GDSL-type esterase/lipase family protein [Myxococcota bacterium]